MSKLFMVVNEDRFFLSHRKPVAEKALKEGFNVTVVTKDTGCIDKVRELGVKVLPLPIDPTGMNPKEELKTFRFLYNLYKTERPDIVHHVGLKNILWGGLAARFLDIPGVVNAVCGLGSLFIGDRISLVAKGILSVMKFSNCKSGVKVIFQNNDDMSLFIYRHIVTPEQVEFTKGSGIDLNEYSYEPEHDSDVVKVIFTARMVREKGVCTLIDAAESLKKEYEGKVRFILCGRVPPNKNGITEEYLRFHCDGNYLCWLGERDDVHDLLVDSHIMAFPSYYREGVPKSLIEAAAIGRPIITCDSTGCRDVVDPGRNGYLICPQNSEELAKYLRKLIDSPELRKKMGVASRKKAERDFSIDKVVETHIRIYREMRRQQERKSRR